MSRSVGECAQGGAVSADREQADRKATYRIFNQAERFAQGWYWAVRSHTLTPKKPQNLNLLGRNLTLFRTDSGKPIALETQIYYKQVKQNRLEATTSTWPLAERYGLVWIWVGDDDADIGEIPHVPALGDRTCDVILGDRIHRKCHPNVLLINAIDANHFNSVHNLPLEIRFDV
ncbi:MAG: hypothetical protein AAFY72_04150, partial [Cyanobacteria bacterium J06649_4]